MADKKDASKAKEHEYLDFYGKQWDRCLIDTTFKTIGGTVVGTVFSFLFFKRSAWPITLGVGVGLGAGYTNCKHQMWWRHWRYGAKLEGPGGYFAPPALGPPWGGPQRRWEKCPIHKDDKKSEPKPDAIIENSEKSSQPSDGESS